MITDNACFEYVAANYLDATPQEFFIDQFGKCKLAFNGNQESGIYTIQIKEVLSTDLPSAPPIRKENVPDVCQSDTLSFLGEVKKRFTFQLFIYGLLHQIIAEHNARSLTTSLEVEGKLEKQWEGQTLDKVAE